MFVRGLGRGFKIRHNLAGTRVMELVLGVASLVSSPKPSRLNWISGKMLVRRNVSERAAIKQLSRQVPYARALIGSLPRNSQRGIVPYGLVFQSRRLQFMTGSSSIRAWILPCWSSSAALLFQQPSAVVSNEESRWENFQL